MTMQNFVRTIQVPKIVKKLEMGEYDPAFKEQSLRVWVNLDRAMLAEYASFQQQIRELEKQMRPSGKGWLDKLLFNPRRMARVQEDIRKANQRVYAWYATVWSQHHNADTHVTAEDVERFAKQLMAEDESLWRWVTQHTQALIIAHQEGLQKN